jgi:hypothetical protein
VDRAEVHGRCCCIERSVARSSSSSAARSSPCSSTKRPAPLAPPRAQPVPACTVRPGRLSRICDSTQYRRRPQSSRGVCQRPRSITLPGGITLDRQIRLQFATPASSSAESKAASEVGLLPQPVTSVIGPKGGASPGKRRAGRSRGCMRKASRVR